MSFQKTSGIVPDTGNTSILQVPYRSWVPEWMQVVVAFFILIPTLMINGAYSGSSIDISGFFGALSEDLNFAFYAASAGMAVAYPVTRVLKMAATPKTIILSSLVLQVALSVVCLHAEHIETIALFSFLIGFLKAFALREVMIILMPVFGGAEAKLSSFYSVYYPITLALAQLSMLLTAELAYTFKWQYMYYFMIALLLAAIIMVLVCLRYARRPVMVHLAKIDWLSMVLGFTFFLSLIYMLTYGKVDDWFSSQRIWISLIVSVSALLLFVRRQLLLEEPYVDLSILQYPDTLSSYALLLVLMLFGQTNALVSAYTTSVLRLDAIHSNILYLWMVPGIIAAAPVTYWWYEKKLPQRILIVMGFGCFVASNAVLYFQIASQGTYQALYPLMMLKGFGMLVMFVALGTRANLPLPRDKKLSNAFFMIGIRSIIVPVAGYALFSNWLYNLQVRNTMVLSENLNMQNPIFADRYTQSLHAALAQGMSAYDSQVMATTAAYQSVQVQAVMVSIKTIMGYCVIAGIVIMLVLAVVPVIKREKPADKGVGTDMV